MNVINSQLFAAHIVKLNQRAEALYQNSKQLPWQEPQHVMTCLEDLWVALEELRVAEEELQQQNQELLATQKAIAIERQRYQDLFEFAPDGYLVTDLQGTVQEANRAAARLFNRSSEQLISQLLANFVAESDRHSFQIRLSQLHILNRLEEWEVQLGGQQQTRFDASLTVETVRDQAGAAIALRWLVRDITARKATEAQIQRVQLQNLQLVEADRLKGQFLAIMSHELRTPMNAILGFSDLLLRRFHSQQDSQITDMVERIFHNGRHLLSMIEAILDFSKLQSRRLDLRLEPFNLAELATEVINDLRPLATQRLLALNLHLTQPQVQVVNDRARLRQVITNLVSNAVKFTEVGEVTLEIWELPEGRVAIIVRDTGIGIAPEAQAQIFREFWQVNQTPSRPYGGTGLGLAIARSLVHLMQGAISVESQLGIGSTFCVEIPRRVQAELR